MGIKLLLGLGLSLLLSSNVMAQSHGNGNGNGNGNGHGHGRPARPSVQPVPELDGSMAFLALGLTFAVGALVREKRRTN